MKKKIQAINVFCAHHKLLLLLSVYKRYNMLTTIHKNLTTTCNQDFFKVFTFNVLSQYKFVTLNNLYCYTKTQEMLLFTYTVCLKRKHPRHF